MADAEKPELIIVRRRSAFDGGEAHGSVWKIAYADFMTAMMAFFLVMWLISATNQETRESVATYFNPIKLAELDARSQGDERCQARRSRQGEEGDSARPLPDPDKATQSTKRPQAPQTHFDEAALFRDPYAVLSEIAGRPSAHRANGRLARSNPEGGDEGRRGL